MNYRILEISTQNFNFKNNLEFNKTYQIAPKFGKKTIQKSKNIFELFMVFSLHNTESTKSPYDIDLEIKAEYELTNGSEKEIAQFNNENAIAIVFPYLRSTLSSLMAAMMLEPIILPIIDAREIFKE